MIEGKIEGRCLGFPWISPEILRKKQKKTRIFAFASVIGKSKMEVAPDICGSLFHFSRLIISILYGFSRKRVALAYRTTLAYIAVEAASSILAQNKYIYNTILLLLQILLCSSMYDFVPICVSQVLFEKTIYNNTAAYSIGANIRSSISIYVEIII